MTNISDKEVIKVIERALSDALSDAIAEFYLDGTKFSGSEHFARVAMDAGANGAWLSGVRLIESYDHGTSTGIQYTIPNSDIVHEVWLDFIPAQEYLIEREAKAANERRAAARAETIRIIKGTAWLIAFGVACFVGLVLTVGLPE